MQEKDDHSTVRCTDKATAALCAGEPLAAHTTFRIGGPAVFWCAPQDAEQLRETLRLCRENGVRVYLLGNGSNTLFDDAGFDGAVVDMRGLSQMESSDAGTDVVRITAGGRPDLGPPVQQGAGARPDRTGVRLRHPRHGGRCRLYERRCLRRGNEGRAGECDLSG